MTPIGQGGGGYTPTTSRIPETELGAREALETHLKFFEADFHKRMHLRPPLVSLRVLRG